MGDVQGDIAKDMRAKGLNPYGPNQITRQPTASADLREREARLRHALEVIRDAENLSADALQSIAYAVVGPRIVVRDDG